MQRKAVLGAVHALGGHPTAADVYARLREDHPHLSLATVYRALHALVAQGVIGEAAAHIENITRYDCSPAPHPHAVCRACGSVADLAGPLPASFVRAAVKSSGFVLDSLSVQFSGLCPDCAAAAAAARG